MKLEELLQAIIDKQYPKDFLFNTGICANIRFLIRYSELLPFDKAIAALYEEIRFPVAGREEYYSNIGTNMYESGLRADLCARVLEYLKSPWYKKFYIRVFRNKRYTEAYPDNPNNPANQGVET